MNIFLSFGSPHFRIKVKLCLGFIRYADLLLSLTHALSSSPGSSPPTLQQQCLQLHFEWKSSFMHLNVVLLCSTLQPRLEECLLFLFCGILPIFLSIQATLTLTKLSLNLKRKKRQENDYYYGCPEVSDDVAACCEPLQHWHLMITDGAMWDFLFVTVFLVNGTLCSINFEGRASHVMMSIVLFTLWSLPARSVDKMDGCDWRCREHFHDCRQRSQRWVWRENVSYRIRHCDNKYIQCFLWFIMLTAVNLKTFILSN